MTNLDPQSIRHLLKRDISEFLLAHDIFLVTMGVSTFAEKQGLYSISLEANCSIDIINKTDFKSNSAWLSYSMAVPGFVSGHEAFTKAEPSLSATFYYSIKLDAFNVMKEEKEQFYVCALEHCIAELSKQMPRLIYDKASRDFDSDLADILSKES